MSLVDGFLPSALRIGPSISFLAGATTTLAKMEARHAAKQLFNWLNRWIHIAESGLDQPVRWDGQARLCVHFFMLNAQSIMQQTPPRAWRYFSSRTSPKVEARICWSKGLNRLSIRITRRHNIQVDSATSQSFFAKVYTNNLVASSDYSPATRQSRCRPPLWS